nr:MAG TPA: Short C-terminal domain [Caudoviricetes sp.]
MTSEEIRKSTNTLESMYPDGGCVSRQTIYQHGLDDGIITQNEYNEAKKFYGSLWNYVGD